MSSSALSSSDSAILERFIEFLQIRTVHPKPDYPGVTAWLERQASELGLPFRVVEPVKGKPVQIMSIEGREKGLPAVMLYCHTDVVPVNEEKWDTPPFEARVVGDRIFARGTQDMKIVGAHYLEAIRRLKASNPSFQTLRTIHLVFGPDEEIGGHDGVRAWISHPSFKELNIGFALDEGIASPVPRELRLFYAERSPWWVWVSATGNEGHGSQFIANAAPAKLVRVVQKFLNFRDVSEELLKYGKRPDLTDNTLGDVTSVNLTFLKAGVQFNVVPGLAEAGFDIRVSPWHVANFEEVLKAWCATEEEVTYRFEQKFDSTHVTSLEADKNPFYGALTGVAEREGLKLRPEIFPAASDSRFVRSLNIPALGISYLHDVEPLLHHHNEYVTKQLLFDGIGFYEKLIPELGNVPGKEGVVVVEDVREKA